MENRSRKRHARILRNFRKIHRITGILLFAFFFIVAITGLLLGWKKNSGNYLLAKSYKGVSVKQNEWMSIDNLRKNADSLLHTAVSPDLSTEIDRIDIRPDKGMAKFLYRTHYWGLQLDCTTGKLLHVDRRRSDFIEHIHDGSILDTFFGTNGIIKLFYTSIMGIALIIFTVTGFWLWYGPKRMRHYLKKPLKK